GRAQAERRLAAALDQAVREVAAFGPSDVSASGDPAGPVVSAAFEGADRSGRAVGAAGSIRDAVMALPHPGFEACTGIDSGKMIDAATLDIAFRSVGTVRMFAGRLREFAGPGQIFLSDEARTELAGRVLVRSVGLVR